jgi:6-pyruvoyltetrahydropterin/6-carboxytetrahydropterin synthase
MYRIEIRHHIETAHRFFHAIASPKCRSIHGHSWLITLSLTAAELDDQGMVIEFGDLKQRWRTWLDTHLDHGILLNRKDPMVQAIRQVDEEVRIFLLPTDPTTETLAEFLFQQADHMLKEGGWSDRVQVERVHVQETQVNSAAYEPS